MSGTYALYGSRTFARGSIKDGEDTGRSNGFILREREDSNFNWCAKYGTMSLNVFKWHPSFAYLGCNIIRIETTPYDMLLST